MRASMVILALLVCVCPLVQSCGSTAYTPPPGTTPIRELVAQKRCPVEVVRFAPEFNPVVHRFRVELKNVCDKPIKLVKWTQLFFTNDGKVIVGVAREGGFAELGGIEPGGAYTGVMMVPDQAVRGTIVIRSLAYESVPPGAENNESMQLYKINYKWENPSHDETVRKLTESAGTLTI